MNLNKISDTDLINEYRSRFTLPKGTPWIQSIDDTLTYLRGTMPRDREQMILLHLNGKNLLICEEVMFTGTLTTSTIYPREVIKSILKNESAAVILIHNHPSGNKQPSRDDINITQKIKAACEVISVTVHDHVIITMTDYYSFADHGLV
jgi:DNA repair protein RadC